MLKAKRIGQTERDSLLTALSTDYRSAELEPADRALLDYAIKLTEAPASTSEDDIRALRRHGFGDRAIHDACAITAYFAFVNRIADGLGVELESDRTTLARQYKR